MNNPVAKASIYSLRTVSVLGTQVSEIPSYEHVSQYIHEQVQEKRKTFCIAINPEKLHRARYDGKLRAAIDQADLKICDGVGVSLASWVLYGRKIPRCTGVDLFLRLVKMAAEKQWKIFFLGASPESNQRAVEKLRELYPNLCIAGAVSGFFDNSEQVVEQINKSGADVLFVAMGSPRQEYWISDYLPRLCVSFCMGVGGSFDVVSGTARRAPTAFRTTGTEWFYRLVVSPSRARRQIALPLFAVRVFQEWLHPKTIPPVVVGQKPEIDAVQQRKIGIK